MISNGTRSAQDVVLRLGAPRSRRLRVLKGGGQPTLRAELNCPRITQDFVQSYKTKGTLAVTDLDGFATGRNLTLLSLP